MDQLEMNLVNAFKSLKSAAADPGFSILGPSAADAIVQMMNQIRAALVAIEQKKVEAQVDAALA